MSTTTVTADVQNVASIITAIAPIIDLADPALGTVLSAVSQIAVGVAAAEPTAVSLYNQIISGTTPTADEMATYIAANEASFAQLQADISTALATKTKT